MKHPLSTTDYRLPTTEKTNRKTFGHLLNENLITIRLFLLIFGDIDENFITQFYYPSKCRIHWTKKKRMEKYIGSELHICPMSAVHFVHNSHPFIAKWDPDENSYCSLSSPIIYKSHIKLSFYYVLLLRLSQTHFILSIFQSNSFIFVSFDFWICEPHFSLQIKWLKVILKYRRKKTDTTIIIKSPICLMALLLTFSPIRCMGQRVVDAYLSYITFIVCSSTHFDQTPLNFSPATTFGIRSVTVISRIDRFWWQSDMDKRFYCFSRWTG